MFKKFNYLAGFLLITAVVICNQSKAFAQVWTFTPEDKAIIDLQRIGAEIDAVEIDVSGWMNWGELEKKKWGEPLKEASSQLERIKSKAQDIVMPDDFQNLRSQTVDLITKLQIMYKILPSMTDKEIGTQFKAHFTQVDSFNSAMNDMVSKFYKMPDLSKGFQLNDEEAKLIRDETDKANYRKAIALLKSGKFLDSRNILNQLLKKYQRTNVEAGLVTRLVDCYYMKDSNLSSADIEEKILKRMKNIMNRKEYSPFLYDLFYRWRTIEQSYEHGMSNMSEIPNDEYIQRQWDVIEVLMRQVEKHPEDGWAKQQILILASLGDIRRGGDYGNSNLDAFGDLFFPPSKNQTPTETIDSWHEQALKLKNEGKYKEAEILFKRILTAEPTNVNVQFDLGNVYLLDKKYDEAIKYYKNANNLGVSKDLLAEYYFNMSLSYIGLGNNKEAIDGLEKCLNISPNYNSAKALLEMVKEAYKKDGNKAVLAISPK